MAGKESGKNKKNKKTRRNKKPAKKNVPEQNTVAKTPVTEEVQVSVVKAKSPAYDRKTHNFAYIHNAPVDPDYKYHPEDYDSVEDVTVDRSKQLLAIKSLVRRVAPKVLGVTAAFALALTAAHYNNTRDYVMPDYMKGKTVSDISSSSLSSGDAVYEGTGFASRWVMADGLSEMSSYESHGLFQVTRYQSNHEGVKVSVSSHSLIGVERVIDEATNTDKSYMCFKGSHLFRLPNLFAKPVSATQLNDVRVTLDDNKVFMTATLSEQSKTFPMDVAVKRDLLNNYSI